MTAGPGPAMMVGMQENNPQQQDKFVAIVASGPSERRTLNRLFVSEGFPVETFGSMREFNDGGDMSMFGCLIVDLDEAGGAAAELSLVQFATRWSRELPVIVIATDEGRLPGDPLLPAVAKSAGETRLLYLVYGALSEPSSLGIQRCSPLRVRED